MTTLPAQAHSKRTFWLATAAFAACSIAAAVRSHGFLEADGGTHYILARHAFEYPPYLLDVWGRPVCTFVLAIGAELGGLVGAKLVSLCIAIGIAAVAQAIARGQQMRQPALAAIFTFGQPLLFLHSFSELTELPFALLLGLALLAYQRRQWGWMTALAAISPLARPEGFALLPIVLIALIAHRRFRWILILPMGIVLAANTRPDRSFISSPIFQR
jgi:Gpi18-like mannosyltransferase